MSRRATVLPFGLGLLLFACGAEPATDRVPDMPPAEEEPATQEPLPTAEDLGVTDGPPHACAELTRKGCLDSTACTLVLVEPEEMEAYACRPSSGGCEEELAQARLPDEPQLCTGREGCAYQEPQCYCHCRGYGQTAVADGDEAEGCDCECAGGLPPACVTAPATG